MLIFIPVRLASTRLPRKAVADIAGLPMMIHVGKRAVEAMAGDVVFACGDQELVEIAQAHGFAAVLTDPNLPTGTDRVYAAYKALGSKDEHIINLQGDMPFINPSTIASTAQLLRSTDAHIATAVYETVNTAASSVPSVVKAVLTDSGRALYFSRTAQLPYGDGPVYHHLGIYGYKASALEKFVHLPQSPLEKRENLEQLRALENGMLIDATIVNDYPQSVDTPADLETVLASVG